MATYTARPQARPQAKPPAKARPRWFWPTVIAVGVLAVLVLVLGGIRKAAVSRAQQELNKAVGQAASWRIDIGLLAIPRLLLGQSIDLHIQGDQVQVRNVPPIKQVVVDGAGLAVDIKGKKLSGADKIEVDLTLDEKSVGAFLEQHALTTKAFSEPKVVFGQGDLELSGALQSSALSFLAGGGDRVQVTAHAVPEITPPASVGLRVDNVRIVTPNGEQKVPTEFIAGIIARDLCLPMDRWVRGLTLTNASVSKDGFRVKGTIDPAQLGKQPHNAPPPPQPGPSTTT